MWSVWQPDRELDFNGFFIESKAGNLVVDPIAPDGATLEDLRRRGVATILITNRDHERAAAAVREATGAKTVASVVEAPLLSAPVDATVAPGDLVLGWTVVGLDGFKTPGEIALIDRRRRTVIVGDALWGTPAGALTLMPDAKLADPVRAALSARALRAAEIRNVLVGDGACIFGNGQAALNAMFDARSDAFVDRVNLFDEVTYLEERGYPPPFAGSSADVGLLLGAERLGYQAAKLSRGEVFSPLHWHTREEELFVVMAGTPSLRTPRGTFVLRAGDCVAFRTGPGGAHRLENHADEEAHVLLIAGIDRGDVCYYPDSHKVLVEQTDTLVRDSPQLDYFDGESS
jgi:uncharacterized cupin superfamily protein